MKYHNSIKVIDETITETIGSRQVYNYVYFMPIIGNYIFMMWAVREFVKGCFLILPKKQLYYLNGSFIVWLFIDYGYAQV